MPTKESVKRRCNMKNYGIILASGTGSRFGSDIPKQFIKICNKTILEWCVEAFEQAKGIDKIIVVITPEYKEKAEKILSDKYKKIEKIVSGGAERKDSSLIGISCVNEDEANVYIQDCARPLVSQKIINDCVECMKTNDACTVAIPSNDTVYKIENNIVESIPERKTIMRAQTPQCFKLSLIKKAHELSKNDTNFTDDCGLIIRNHLCPVKIINGSEENIKITYKDDIYFAEQILKSRK